MTIEPDHTKVDSFKLDLYTEMDSIHILEKEYSNDIKRKYNKIFSFVENFESYSDLYTFVKKTCKTQEEFNTTMLILRPLWLDKKRVA
jgi:hypothetical protein